MNLVLHGALKLSGIRVYQLWTALGKVLGLPWALFGIPSRSWSGLGALRASSLVLAWRSWGALGSASGLTTPPGIDFGRILGRLGGRFVSVW